MRSINVHRRELLGGEENMLVAPSGGIDLVARLSAPQSSMFVRSGSKLAAAAARR